MKDCYTCIYHHKNDDYSGRIIRCDYPLPEVIRVQLGSFGDASCGNDCQLHTTKQQAAKKD